MVRKSISYNLCFVHKTTYLWSMSSPGGGELSLFACPGVGNRLRSENKIANPRGYARGGMVTGRIEKCITPNSAGLESIWSRPNIFTGFRCFYIAIEQITLIYKITSFSSDEIFWELVLLSRAAIVIMVKFLSCAMFVFHR